MVRVLCTMENINDKIKNHFIKVPIVFRIAVLRVIWGSINRERNSIIRYKNWLRIPDCGWLTSRLNLQLSMVVIK